ncbi:MAG: glycosyltransferase [Candidatus Omnitrophica bacterium]|nr:glycosyltransferase [Candidatus Omnitrophota bacterium]MCM8828360.1 glycosyltransferase [Candidatus Omnitrophota bacterium]
MKIVFCLVRYIGGNRNLGVSLEEQYWVEPLRQLGHDVFIFEIDDYLVGPGLASKKDDGRLLEYVKKIKPDWVVMNDYSNDSISEQTWMEIAGICKSSDWFGDDNHRYDNYTKYKASYFTHPITCDFFSYDKYLRDGYTNVIMSQWAAFNFDNVEEEETDAYLYDVTFVGTFSLYRKCVYDYLKKNKVSVQFYGSGWPGGTVTLGQMKNIFRTSRINLSLEKLATNYDIRFLISDKMRFLSFLKRTIMNRSLYTVHKQIKTRHFDICMCGGFQISEYVPMIEKYFEIGKELVVFSSLEEMLSLIQYYTKREYERKKIAQAGQQRTKSQHLMINRWQEVIRQLERKE